MAYKLVGFKNLDKRTIAYGLYLMSNLDQRIVVQPSQDYFLAQVENLKITSEEIETFNKIVDNFLVSNTVVYSDDSLCFKLFCYHFLTNFYTGYSDSYHAVCFLLDFFDDLVFRVDASLAIMPYHPSYFRQSIPNPLIAQPNWQPQQVSNPYPVFPNANMANSHIVVQQPIIPPMAQPSLYPQQAVNRYPVFPDRNTANPSIDAQELEESSHQLKPNRLIQIYNHLKNTHNLGSKVEFFRNVKKNYIAARHLLSLLGWLQVSNTEQLMWSVEYLEKLNIPVYPPSFLPEKNQDIYDAIVATLMVEGFSSAHAFSKSNVENLIKKMNQAWYQKSYRDLKNSENALNYLLSKKHLKKLQSLTEVYGDKPLKVLEAIIDNEYEQVVKNK